MKVEAEGAASDLLNIARQHAKDHKDRLKTFVQQRITSVRVHFESGVAK